MEKHFNRLKCADVLILIWETAQKLQENLTDFKSESLKLV